MWKLIWDRDSEPVVFLRGGARPRRPRRRQLNAGEEHDVAAGTVEQHGDLHFPFFQSHGSRSRSRAASPSASGSRSRDRTSGRVPADLSRRPSDEPDATATHTHVGRFTLKPLTKARLILYGHLACRHISQPCSGRSSGTSRNRAAFRRERSPHLDSHQTHPHTQNRSALQRPVYE